MTLPITKIKRAFTGGKTAVKMGGNTLKYMSKKPFQNKEFHESNKAKMHKENAELLFKGLSQLKGTALKIAQLLCLELELLPDEYRVELEKSCYQVPPMNQAMVLKILKKEYGKNFHETFDQFDTKAFAAASLGQVHYAKQGKKEYAIKLQYPSIKDTIDNDIQLVLKVSKKFKEFHLIEPALKEIRERLFEETDYLREAKNTQFFKDHYKAEQVFIPKVHSKFSSEHVICTDYISGVPLIDWIHTDAAKDQSVRDRIGQSLFDFFIHSCYELHQIHADPNPGNFIITPDNQLAIIDFGCMKKLDVTFMNYYKKIPGYVMTQNKTGYIQTLMDLNLLKSDVSDETKDHIFETVYMMSDWLSKPYSSEFFDFKAHPEYMAKGKEYSEHFFEFTSHVEMNPEFLYLERTRHGLLRIFEKLQAKVSMQNAYEWKFESV